MPITYNTLKVSCPYYTWDNTTKSMKHATNTEFAWTEWETRKPEPYRRKKPDDLFMGTTPRVVEGYRCDTGFVNCGGSGPGKTLYVGIPAINVWPHNTYDSYGLPGDLPDATAMHNAIRSNVRDEAVNLAMALAEYQTTAKLFLDAATVLRKKGKGLKKLYKDVDTAITSAAQAHLAVQYGVKPLCSDILQAIEDLKNAAVAKPLYKRGKVKRSVQYRKVQVGVSANYANEPGTGTITWTYTRTRKMKYRATLNKDGLLRTLTAHGFTNPFSLAWELIPFSFVVDWWISVGDFLQSLDNSTFIQDIYVADGSYDLTVIECSGGGKNVSGGGYKAERKRTQRHAPQPISLISKPVYKPSISKQHILNGLALLRVLQKSR